MTEEPLDEVEALLIEILEAVERGEDPDERIDRHPDHAAALRRRLARIDHLGLRAGGNARRPSIPGYRLDELIGRGGMAEVWSARRESDDLRVAIKRIRHVADSTALLKRFQRESESLEKLDHPAIVRIHDCGEAEGSPFIVMDCVEGKTLSEALAERPRFDPRRVIVWGARIADALSHAHAQGVIHRDIKPGNILVKPDDTVVLIDFGLIHDLSSSTLTMPGHFLGSPHYASPEQVRGAQQELGPTTDVYSLGVTLYEALAGRLPFDGRTSEALFHQILTRQPPDLRSADRRIPRDLATVIDKAMEKRPEHRYATAAEFRDDLEAVLALAPVRARRPSLRRRVLRWSRARPTTATVIVGVFAALLVMTGIGLYRARDTRLERQDRARRELAAATALLDRHARRNEGLPERIQRFDWRRMEIVREPHSAAEIAAIDAEQLALERIETESEQVFTEVMEILRRVEDLDPGLDGPADLRARLYYERWRVARAARDGVMTEFLARRVREHDPDGPLAEKVRARRRLELVTEPPGARIDAFAFRRHDHVVAGGQPRLVPVPFRQHDIRSSGRPALRVRWAAAPLMPEDLILGLDGETLTDEALSGWRGAGAGARARVWRDGREFELRLPDGLGLRPTLSPLLHDASSFVGMTPLQDAEVEGDDLLLLVRAEGYEPERLVLGAMTKKTLKLIPLGSLPRPFVRIHSHYGGEMIVMDREVTCGEYLTYLNALPKSGDLPSWAERRAGTSRMRSGLAPTLPAHEISWNDAVAYAGWRTEQARAEGRDWSFRLPDWREFQVFVKADGAARRFPWGNDFRPTYCKSCFSRDEPRLEPGLSFAVDETVMGLHDTAGSVSELCDGWFWEARGQRPAHGGSWQHAEPTRFESTYAWGIESDSAREHVGFRLVLVREKD